MIHVSPINDIKPHTRDTICSCNPRIISYLPEIIVIHNSFDGREGVEIVEEILRDIKKKKDIKEY